MFQHCLFLWNKLRRLRGTKQWQVFYYCYLPWLRVTRAQLNEAHLGTCMWLPSEPKCLGWQKAHILDPELDNTESWRWSICTPLVPLVISVWFVPEGLQEAGFRIVTLFIHRLRGLRVGISRKRDTDTQRACGNCVARCDSPRICCTILFGSEALKSV